MGGVSKEAQGAGVGPLVSEYTRMVSAEAGREAGFDEGFRAEQVATLQSIREHETFNMHDADPMNSDLTMDELRKALKCMQSKLYKSPGPDGITNWMLVWGGEAVFNVLYELLAAAWRSRALPEQWGLAEIVYLYKNKGDRQEVSNYRPISLTSAVGKLYTKVLLHRIQPKVEAALSKNQGCARSGQGATEHLWATLSVIREHARERGPVYGFFADAAKAYDQVWREGLYLALYGIGIRGRMWYTIQDWLATACATTKWNSVTGPQVQLEQGLRQGCVLSPALYCVFVDCLVATGPTVPVPPQHTTSFRSFYSQGLQSLSTASGAGLVSDDLEEPLLCTLYMDDTSLLASSVRGLKRAMVAYLNFCNKFRMMVNAGKSKLLCMGGEENEGFSITIGSQTFQSTKAQKLLGYWCESDIRGEKQVQGAVGKGLGKAQGVGIVSARLGEAQGLRYLESTVAPGALYGLELSEVEGAGRRLDGVWQHCLGEATLIGKANSWKSTEPIVSKKSLLWHSTELPWSAQVEANRARLAGKLGSLQSGLAAEIFAAQKARGSFDTVLQVGRETLTKAGVGLERPARGAALDHWRKQLKASLEDGQCKNLRSLKAQQTQSSDSLSIRTLGGSLGQAEVWEGLIPDMGLRTKVHKTKLGCLGFTRTARAKVMSQQRKWTKLSLHARKQMVRCPCGAMEQNPHHVWFECPLARPILNSALSRPNAPDWNIVPVHDRLIATLSPEKLVDLEALRSFKLSLIQSFVQGIQSLEATLGVSKQVFEQEHKQKLLAEQVPEGCENCWVLL